MGPTDWPSLDDVALVEAGARGEVPAFSALYDRYCGLLLGMAQRMLGERSAAEDLVHDVFMEIWRRCDSYDRSRGTVRTWMMIRLRSRALDRIRQSSIRREVPDEGVVATHVASDKDDPSLVPDRAAVRTALLALPDDQREVVELAYFQGLSSSEIARAMGSPLGTVKSRTAAAMVKLRAAMQDQGGLS